MIATAYGENTKEHLDRYVKAVEDAEKIDAMLKADMEKYPEAYNAYLKAKEKVDRGETLTEQELLDYEGVGQPGGAGEEARAEAKALEDGGVLESGFSYAERDRQRVNEGQLTQVEELSQYAGNDAGPIARQEASKLLTELYNQQYKLKKGHCGHGAGRNYRASDGQRQRSVGDRRKADCRGRVCHAALRGRLCREECSTSGAKLREPWKQG